MANLDLRTAAAQFDGAWRLITTARRGVTHVRIPTATLKALMVDHSAMCAALNIDHQDHPIGRDRDATP